MLKKVRDLGIEVEDLTKTLAETEFEAKETQLSAERTAKEVQEKHELIESLKAELERCASGLGVSVDQAGGTAGVSEKSVADEQLEELNELMAQKKQLKVTLRDSEKQERDARGHADALEEQLNSLRGDLADEERKAYGEDTGGSSGEMAAAIAESRQIISEKSVELSETQQAVARLRNQMAEMNTELGQAQRSMLVAQAKNKGSSASAQGLTDRKFQAVKDLKTIETKLKQFKANPEAATTEALQGLPEQVAQAKEAITKEKADRQKQQRRQAAELKETTESFQKDLRKREHAEETLELLAKAKGQGPDELSQKNKELAATTSEVMTIKLEIKEFMAKSSGIEELSDLNKDVAAAQRRTLTLKQAIKTLQVTVKQLEASGEELDEKLRQLSVSVG